MGGLGGLGPQSWSMGQDWIGAFWVHWGTWDWVLLDLERAIWAIGVATFQGWGLRTSWSGRGVWISR